MHDPNIIDLFPKDTISEIPTYFSYSKSLENSIYIEELYNFFRKYDYIKHA